jgi:hypothetical protein
LVAGNSRALTGQRPGVAGKVFAVSPAGLTDNFVLRSIMQIFDEPVTKIAEKGGFRNLLAGL